MTENNDVTRMARPIGDTFPREPTPEPQDYPGLDAGGFLLVALAHLTAAMGKLLQEPPARGTWRARRETRLAINHTRFALKLLHEQKEETCEKS